MRLSQTQNQKLNQQQLQNAKLLQMTQPELREYVQNLAASNPLVEPDDPPEAPLPTDARQIYDKLRWLEESDRQNRFYQMPEPEEIDPLFGVSGSDGLEETLLRFITRQLDSRNIDANERTLVLFLANCLDRDGYFRIPLAELADDIGMPVHELQLGLKLLQSLEPAGIGARDLSECLALQLRRSGVCGTPLEIALHHVESLARHRYGHIAQTLGISREEVLSAENVIRQLDPRPGAIFQSSEQVAFILPDVYLEDTDGRFIARLSSGERPPFHLSPYYLDLLKTAQDKDVVDYLTAHLRQAEQVLYAINARGTTLLRCVEAIAKRQSAFFRSDSGELRQLRLCDVAEDLSLHESTVSRAIRGKYLQCTRGIYPLSYFFTPLAAKNAVTKIGGAAARRLLQELISSEDRRRPMSDQKLCEEMARLGCPISRRTAAKYREALGIPAAFARRNPNG